MFGGGIGGINAISNYNTGETTNTVSDPLQQVQEAESKQNKVVGLPELIKNKISTLQNMSPVTELTGNEFAKSEKKITEQVGDFFLSLGNKVFRKDIGEVIINERSIKSDIAHGIGRRKAVTFAAVPDVIKSGQQISYEENWKGRNYDSYVFAAPVKVGNQTNYVATVVLKEKPNNRFYLHEVVNENGNVIYQSKKSTPDVFKTGVTVQDGVTGTPDVLFDPIITSTVDEVNNNIPTPGENMSGQAEDIADKSLPGFVKNDLLDQNILASETPETKDAVANVLTVDDVVKRDKNIKEVLSSANDSFRRRLIDSSYTINQFAKSTY